MKLFVIPSWYPSKTCPESGLFFKDRAMLLREAGIDVLVLAPILHSFRKILKIRQMNTTNPNPELRTIINEQVNIFPKNEKLAFYRYQKRAINLFNQAIKKYGKPDMVFFNSSIWAGAALYKNLNDEKIPFIVSEHLKEFLMPQGFSNFNKKLIQKTYDSSYKIIATSTALKKSIIKRFKINENKIILVPNPVNEDFFTLKPPSKNKRLSFASVGLLRPEKNFDLIIKAFDKILKSGIDATLNIVGDGPLEAQIKKQINLLGNPNRIKLWGYLQPNQVVEVLHKTDIFIVGSSIETFGVSLVEAQACGIPSVATKCGGPNDIILKDTGVLVQPNSEFYLHGGIMQLIKKIDYYDSENIRKKTIERFGKNIYTNSLKKII
ncbi:MAG: hypothetical protein CMG13_03300 [Candidatus Marinimicrobia bacterium]|nr:hypothetical protein [Candidatus Neomarinimicrobiota bacterium]|tara:strand:- start:4710 stop:5846 length:1137 start_codon:yes stop_codon:yes gene_type:complete